MHREIFISPRTGRPLFREGDSLITDDASENYPILGGVPVLLDGNTAADWHRELMEVLLWQHPSELTALYRDLDWSKPVVPVYIETIRRILGNKDGVRRAIEAYICSDTASWIVEDSGEPYHIPAKEREAFPHFATAEIGEKRVENNRRPDPSGRRAYTCAKVCIKQGNIVELATGAGGGTAIIADGLVEGDAHLYTVDIGFSCLGNALGIGKYLGMEERIHPVCANFWHLPFADGSVSAVFTNFGLDESREIGRTLSEIARILEEGGTFVNISRKNAYLRQHPVLLPFGFSEEETLALLKRARIYADTESLREICGEHGLTAEAEETFEEKFTVLTLKKHKNS